MIHAGVKGMGEQSDCELTACNIILLFLTHAIISLHISYVSRYNYHYSPSQCIDEPSGSGGEQFETESLSGAKIFSIVLSSLLLFAGAFTTALIIGIVLYRKGVCHKCCHLILSASNSSPNSSNRTTHCQLRSFHGLTSNRYQYMSLTAGHGPGTQQNNKYLDTVASERGAPCTEETYFDEVSIIHHDGTLKTKEHLGLGTEAVETDLNGLVTLPIDSPCLEFPS